MISPLRAASPMASAGRFEAAELSTDLPRKGRCHRRLPSARIRPAGWSSGNLLPARDTNESSAAPCPARAGLPRLVEFARSAVPARESVAIERLQLRSSQCKRCAIRAGWPVPRGLFPAALLPHPPADLLTPGAYDQGIGLGGRALESRKNLLPGAVVESVEDAAAHCSSGSGRAPRKRLSAGSAPCVGEHCLARQPHGRLEAAASRQFPANNYSAFLASRSSHYDRPEIAQLSLGNTVGCSESPRQIQSK